MNTTSTLCEFVDALTFEDLPPACVNRIKMAILDTIGCVVMGRNTQAGKILINFVKQSNEKMESTILATNIKTSSSYAALVNGTMGHEFDYDDGVSTALGIHAGITIVPAALAIAEREEVAGKDFVTSVVAGYEFACRVGRAMERTRHVPTLTGAFGATMAAAKLLKLDLDQMTNAIGICGSFSPLRPFGPALKGVMTKDMWGGWSNFFGILCASLAKEGFTGPTDVLEPEGDFYKAAVHSGAIDNKTMITDLGKQYLWMDGHYFKPYSSCRGTHVSLDAIFKLTEKQKIDHTQIDEIILIGRDIVSILKGVFNPISARFSTPYTVAAAIKYGQLTLDEFSERKLKDPEIHALAKKVKTVIDPDIPEWPHAHGPVKAIVKLKNGTALSATAYEERSLDYEGVVNKFRINASRVLQENNVQQAVDIVKEMENVENIRTLIASLSL